MISERTRTETSFKPYQTGKDEEYMSPNMLKHFEAILLKWKKSLQEEVDRTMENLQTEAVNYADPADRAAQEEEFRVELRARDRERKLIKKIDQSLEMIQTEEYGYCQSCGVEIGVKRLEARPTAELCIDCKTISEVKEKQTGDD